MPQRRWFSALASLLFLSLAFPCVCSQASGSDTTIRVGLLRSFRNAKQITVTPSSIYSIFTAGSTDKLATYSGMAAVTVDLDESGLSIVSADSKPVKAGASVTIVPGDPLATMEIDSPGNQHKQYRGKIEISAQSSGLLIVDILNLEDYLPGVLVGEMPSSFPEEALKSQAIAARCYTLCARGKHSAAGFDVCDGVHCQVFDGCLRKTPQVLSAVAATKGQVLTYKSKICSVMYHGDCGGATQCYSDVYDKGNYPYLCGVREPAGVPYSTWEKSYEPAELEAKLIAAGVKEVRGLQTVTITKTSSSGRALELGITGADVSVGISGSRLRYILGEATLKSTLFTIVTADDGTITFKGKGHGHGIGMSQVGAKALALAPFNYTYSQILNHYFPGTTLSSAGAAPKKVAGNEKRQPVSPSIKMDSASAFGVRVQEPKL